jgi:hypothetical protein
VRESSERCRWKGQGNDGCRPAGRDAARHCLRVGFTRGFNRGAQVYCVRVSGFGLAVVVMRRSFGVPIGLRVDIQMVMHLSAVVVAGVMFGIGVHMHKRCCERARRHRKT